MPRGVFRRILGNSITQYLAKFLSNKSMSRLGFGEQGAKREDQGYYRVVASNNFGTTEKTAYLIVQCKSNSFRYFFVLICMCKMC